MRLAAYAGVSSALACGALLRAFHERPNFYSASVYLSQSSACRMILANFLLLSAGTVLYALQRLLYGRLRAIEIEQLWDRGWYTITETALAMTTFRDEVGIWFFIMFVGLLAGKVWSWISEGRVETLEQQPPANPKLFHTRLVASLLLSEAFDLFMLRYCVKTILDQPRPGMMVMFAFEFAVLAISSSSITARYGITLHEISVVKSQTKARIDELRAELRSQRANATSDIPAAAVEDDIDENEVRVPGWQDKGRWILFLDLATDFLKLVIYTAFFSILIMFHGIPIHIFRDLYVTARSFVKRINDYFKYRNATRDMHSRYLDATAEELERDGICIICRDDMRPWQQPNTDTPERPTTRLPPDEWLRPKKLPCGHILHFGCLRGWLERQQACPTCRRSVLDPSNANSAAEPRGNEGVADGQLVRQGNPNNQQPDQAGHPPAGQPRERRRRRNFRTERAERNEGNDRNNRNDHNGQNGVRMRAFNFGPLRLMFGAANPRNIDDMLRQGRGGAVEARRRRSDSPSTGSHGAHRSRTDDNSLFNEIANIEQRLTQQINSLNAAQEQLVSIRAMQAEFHRLRATHDTAANSTFDREQNSLVTGSAPVLTGRVMTFSQQPITAQFTPQQSSQGNNQIQGLLGRSQGESMNSGDPGLPEGMILPEGWSLVPLQRLAIDMDEAETGVEGNELMDINILPQTNVQASAQIPADSTEDAAPSWTNEALPALNSMPTTIDSDLNGGSSSHTLSNTTLSQPNHGTNHVQNPGPTENIASHVNLPNWTSPSASPTTWQGNVDPTSERASDSTEGNRLSSQDSNEPTENGVHDRQKDKGKARAATVEEVVDEEGD